MTLPDGGVRAEREGFAVAPDASLHDIPAFQGNRIATVAAWWRRPATYVGLGVVVLLAFWLLRPVLTTIALAFAVAYLANPFVEKLARRGIPRALSIVAILGLAFGLVAGGVALLVPVIESEISNLVANIPKYWEKANTFFETIVRPYALDHFGLKLPNTFEGLWKQYQGEITGVAPDVAGRAVKFLKGTVNNFFAFLGMLVNLLLFPVFLFYILNDFPRIQAALVDAVPPRHLPEVRAKVGEVNRVLSAFVRGQLTVCLFLAVCYSLGLLLSGIDMPILIGVVSGAAFVIPYAGTLLGIVLGCAMALVKFGLDWHIAVVIATFGVVQFLESNVVTPRIVGTQVGLHPLVMITAVIVGGTVFGFLGVLLAVPTTAVGAVFWRSGWDRYKASEFYRSRR